MNIAQRDTERIREWNSGLAQTISIRLVRTADERSRVLEAFCEDLGRAASKVDVVMEEGEEGDLPALHVQKEWRYHGVPEANELLPFLELLSLVERGDPQLPETVVSGLREIEWPAELKLYVTPQCPFCPQVLRQIGPFPLANPILHLTVIDGLLFPELGREDDVRSVPTLILDDRFRWTGAVRREEIVDALRNRDPARLSAATLKGMLKEGDAERLTKMMMDQGLIFPAFLELLVHPEWSVRLGAMVVIEELVERTPELARGLAEPLWKRLSTADPSIKGDLIYMLGLVGSREYVPRLQELKKGEKNPEVIEVLEEALKRLES